MLKLIYLKKQDKFKFCIFIIYTTFEAGFPMKKNIRNTDRIIEHAHFKNTLMYVCVPNVRYNAHKKRRIQSYYKYRFGETTKQRSLFLYLCKVSIIYFRWRITNVLMSLKNKNNNKFCQILTYIF